MLNYTHQIYMISPSTKIKTPPHNWYCQRVLWNKQHSTCGTVYSLVTQLSVGCLQFLKLQRFQL